MIEAKIWGTVTFILLVVCIGCNLLLSREQKIAINRSDSSWFTFLGIGIIAWVVWSVVGVIRFIWGIGMKVGSKIRLQYYIHQWPAGQKDFIVEEFRFCLGIFESEQHREAQKFTPLCDLYERGPDSENGYIANFGEYYTNPVQAWMDIV